MLMFYNDFRSGDPFQTGYDLTLFSASPLLGLYKLLFSPLRGLFIYSPILLLGLIGWWQLRHTHTAEAWLLASCVGVTLALFSVWSSGEGLSWGSRFLVPLVPYLSLSLAPIVAHVIHKSAPFLLFRILFALFFVFSMLIQLLAVTINPWVFLNHLQTNFGGEFFLERTDALYDFRYSQIAGQIQMWGVENSDLIWWQPWGFDGLAFVISLFGLILAGVTLWQVNRSSNIIPSATSVDATQPNAKNRSLSLPKAGEFRQLQPTTLLLLTSLYLLLSSGYLLTRYQHRDQQFGPLNDPYSQALASAVNQTGLTDSIINVAQYHYHIPMNRFKPRVPLIGFAQQSPPLPETALPLLDQATQGDSVWLVTIGFPPGAPDNATERWLAFNAYKAHETWFDDVRLVRYSTEEPTMYHALNLRLGDQIRLMDTRFMQNRQAGQLLPVQLTWQPYRQPTADYQVFLQLLNHEGALVTQHDNPPNGGYTNTSSWFVGQRIVSQHALDLPADLPTGDYRLIGGLYDPTTGARLTVAEEGRHTEQGRHAGTAPTSASQDFVELGIVRIMNP
ncbi:hypothetical protein QUF64_04740 [Anaerolineales bacterium HSG6]|nr:hypothetical protein [Anaerolineales bacterium HSG6]